MNIVYPYYVPCHMTEGQLKKLWRNKRWVSKASALSALAKAVEDVTDEQYVILQYTGRYKCKIVFTFNT